MEPKTVLVVEDDEATLETLRHVLEEAGFEVALAGDGEEALWRAVHARPAVVVLDAMMRGRDGFDVCRQLRADPLSADVPILMLTGMPEEAGRSRADAAGCSAYLAKPFDVDDLVAAVRRLAG